MPLGGGLKDCRHYFTVVALSWYRVLFTKANINQFKLIEIPSPLCAVSLPHSGWPPLGGGRDVLQTGTGAHPQLPSRLYVSSKDGLSLLMSPLMTVPRLGWAWSSRRLADACQGGGSRAQRVVGLPSPTPVYFPGPAALPCCGFPRFLRDPFSFVWVLFILFMSEAVLWSSTLVELHLFYPATEGKADTPALLSAFPVWSRWAISPGAEGHLCLVQGMVATTCLLSHHQRATVKLPSHLLRSFLLAHLGQACGVKVVDPLVGISLLGSPSRGGHICSIWVGLLASVESTRMGTPGLGRLFHVLGWAIGLRLLSLSCVPGVEALVRLGRGKAALWRGVGREGGRRVAHQETNCLGLNVFLLPALIPFPVQLCFLPLSSVN